MHFLANLRILTVPRLWPKLLLRRDWIAFTRLQFLASALEAGLLDRLERGASLDELADAIGASDPELLSAFVLLGVALGELFERDGRYQLRGTRVRAIHADDTVAALLTEWVRYHGDVYAKLPRLLVTPDRPDYLHTFGPLIARSSRILEPSLTSLVRELVRHGVGRVLDVGCGSGAYLKQMASVDATLRGLGIDRDAQVVTEARANLERWGLGERFEVVAADARQLPPEAAGPFGLITLFNNVYYFEVAERVSVFASLRERLAARGQLAVAVVVLGPALDVRDFDLILRATAGTTALPSREEVEEQLHAAGFAMIRTRFLAPPGLFAFVASA